MNEQLGTFPHSYGYRADNKLFQTNLVDSCNSKYGQHFGKGDVVGCGLLPAQKQIFYTLNGKYLGVAFNKIMVVNPKQDKYAKRHKDLSALFPAVCMQSTGEEVDLNFTGRTTTGSSNFMFDLQAF